MQCLECLHAQHWSYVACIWMTECISIGMCSELSSPVNGEVTWTGLTTGSTATYTCASDYQLTGDQTRTWSLEWTETYLQMHENALSCSLPHMK